MGDDAFELRELVGLALREDDEHVGRIFGVSIPEPAFLLIALLLLPLARRRS